MSKTLRCYEIPDAIRHCLDNGVNSETGEMTETGLIELRALSLSAEQAVTSLACYVRELELEAEAVKETAAAAMDRTTKLTRRTERLRGEIMATLEATGLSRVKDARITVAIQNNPPSVSVIAASEIPAAYLRIIPEKREPDKTAISAALKNGDDVPGCALIPSRRIAIK